MVWEIIAIHRTQFQRMRVSSCKSHVRDFESLSEKVNESVYDTIYALMTPLWTRETFIFPNPCHSIVQPPSYASLRPSHYQQTFIPYPLPILLQHRHHKTHHTHNHTGPSTGRHHQRRRRALIRRRRRRWGRCHGCIDHHV